MQRRAVPAGSLAQASQSTPEVTWMAHSQAAVNITTLADACNRGAEAVASVLLDDARVDAHAGSDVRTTQRPSVCERT